MQKGVECTKRSILASASERCCMHMAVMLVLTTALIASLSHATVVSGNASRPSTHQCASECASPVLRFWRLRFARCVWMYFDHSVRMKMNVGETLAGANCLCACVLTWPALNTPDTHDQPTPAGGTVTVSNVRPRRDTSGNILESGDGSLHKFGDKWYLCVTHMHAFVRYEAPPTRVTRVRAARVKLLCFAWASAGSFANVGVSVYAGSCSNALHKFLSLLPKFHRDARCATNVPPQSQHRTNPNPSGTARDISRARWPTRSAATSGAAPCGCAGGAT